MITLLQSIKIVSQIFGICEVCDQNGDRVFKSDKSWTGMVFMFRVSPILSYCYRALTQLRLQDFDIRLREQTSSQDPISPKFAAHTSFFFRWCLQWHMQQNYCRTWTQTIDRVWVHLKSNINVIVLLENSVQNFGPAASTLKVRPLRKPSIVFTSEVWVLCKPDPENVPATCWQGCWGVPTQGDESWSNSNGEYLDVLWLKKKNLWLKEAIKRIVIS